MCAKNPLPDVKLHLFFKATKNGPYVMPPELTNKGKQYAEFVKAAFTAWEDEKKASVVSNERVKAALDVKKERAEKKKDELKQRMTAAREKGMAALSGGPPVPTSWTLLLHGSGSKGAANGITTSEHGVFEHIMATQ